MYFLFGFRESQKIEFRNANDLNEVVHSYSVAPHQPVRICTVERSTLLYADDSTKQREIQWLDCSTSLPKPTNGKSITHTLQGYTFDMCCSRYGDKQYLNTTYSSSGVYAYDVIADKFDWKGEPNGTEKKMNAFGITADGRGHLFVCDMSNGCIHVFSTGGVYLGELNGSRIGVPRCIRWCSETSSIVVAHKKDDKRIISVIYVQ